MKIKILKTHRSNTSSVPGTVLPLQVTLCVGEQRGGGEMSLGPDEQHHNIISRAKQLGLRPEGEGEKATPQLVL